MKKINKFAAGLTSLRRNIPQEVKIILQIFSKISKYEISLTFLIYNFYSRYYTIYFEVLE
jgi:hypothetical protein